MKKQHDIRIDRKLLHPRLDYAIDKLLKKCAENGIYIIITEGMRTQERQNELYAQGRTKSGIIVTNAKDSLSSQHGWGIAIDFAINDNALVYNSKYMSKVGTIAKSVGLGWGGDWKDFVDTPHIYLKKWGSITKKLKSKYGTLDKFKKYWNRTLKKDRYLYATKTLKAGGKKKCLIKAGEKVEVLWYSKIGYAKVRYDGKIGYVYRSGFVSVK